jgi:hypothetical protein
MVSRRNIVLAASVALLTFSGAACAQQHETFDPKTFDRPTVIDNEWFPLKPGMQYVWDGVAYDEEGEEEAHQIVFTVTDLTKVIDGVKTIVCWDRDYAEGDLEEAEIVFFAQDNERNVWHFGQYSEEYENDELALSTGWIHGIGDGKAGIMMKAKPKLGTPSYSQGLSISTPWTDRGRVHQMGLKATVPIGSFDDVLVIEESDAEEPESRQLKFYARGVGNIRVGYDGDMVNQELLELTKVIKLDEQRLADAREEALNLDARARERSKEVYVHSGPLERTDGSAVYEELSD